MPYWAGVDLAVDPRTGDPVIVGYFTDPTPWPAQSTVLQHSGGRWQQVGQVSAPADWLPQFHAFGISPATGESFLFLMTKWPPTPAYMWRGVPEA